MLAILMGFLCSDILCRITKQIVAVDVKKLLSSNTGDYDQAFLAKIGVAYRGS